MYRLFLNDEKTSTTRFVLMCDVIYERPLNFLQEDAVEEDPLGSNDDISEEDPSELFNTENVRTFIH